jgi:hypothetical protein
LLVLGKGDFENGNATEDEFDAIVKHTGKTPCTIETQGQGGKWATNENKLYLEDTG